MASFLHIVPDDKFIDDAISFFSEIEGNHRWVSVKIDDNSLFSYIKNDIVEMASQKKIENIVSEGKYEAIVFHSLYATIYSLVLLVPKGKTIIWNSWGADIYYGIGCFPPLVKLDLYKHLTQKFLVEERPPLVKRIKRVLKNALHPSRIKERRIHEKWIRDEREKCVALQHEVISRIDMCSTVLKTEFDELKKIPGFNAVYFPFKYVNKEQMIDQCHFEGDRILVGNSRDFSNNHLDVLDVLDRRNVINKRIVPLSYGLEKTVGVLRKKYNGNEKVELLTDYLDRATYWGIVRSCKAAVFGHIRQQALGNINQCLLQGSKVFLYKDSMVYRFYKEVGAVVFSIEDDLCQQNIDKPLSTEDIDRNRAVVLDLWSYNKVIDQVKESLSFLMVG